ncbi:hypothetical protein MASR2M15_29830 [Anaerolineales bacterium]
MLADYATNPLSLKVTFGVRINVGEKTMAKQNGQLLWLDLTVEDADGIRDFYREVIGWQSKPSR